MKRTQGGSDVSEQHLLEAGDVIMIPDSPFVFQVYEIFPDGKYVTIFNLQTQTPQTLELNDYTFVKFPRQVLTRGSSVLGISEDHKRVKLKGDFVEKHGQNTSVIQTQEGEQKIVNNTDLQADYSKNLPLDFFLLLLEMKPKEYRKYFLAIMAKVNRHYNALVNSTKVWQFMLKENYAETYYRYILYENNDLCNEVKKMLDYYTLNTTKQGRRYHKRFYEFLEKYITKGKIADVFYVDSYHNIDLAYLEVGSYAKRFVCAFQCQSYIFVLMDDGKKQWNANYALEGNYLFKTTNADMHKYKRGVPDPLQSIYASHNVMKLLTYDQTGFVFLTDSYHDNKFRFRYYNVTSGETYSLQDVEKEDEFKITTLDFMITKDNFLCMMNHTTILILMKYHQRDARFSRAYVFSRSSLKLLTVIRNVFFAAIKDARTFHIFYGPDVKQNVWYDSMFAGRIANLIQWIPGTRYDLNVWVKFSDTEYGIRRTNTTNYDQWGRRILDASSYDNSDLTLYDDTQWIILSLPELKQYGDFAYRLRAHLTVDGDQLVTQLPSSPFEQSTYFYLYLPESFGVTENPVSDSDGLTRRQFHGFYGHKIPHIIDDTGRLMDLNINFDPKTKSKGDLVKWVANKEDNDKILDLVSSEFHN